MGELLPCPFCGKWPRRERYNGQWWLRCETCHFVSQPMETADAVDAWWNRRTPSAVLPSEPRAKWERAEKWLAPQPEPSASLGESGAAAWKRDALATMREVSPVLRACAAHMSALQRGPTEAQDVWERLENFICHGSQSASPPPWTRCAHAAAAAPSADDFEGASPPTGRPR